MLASSEKVDKTKYKTEMCKSWIESGYVFCRYGNKCQFAHGNMEIKSKKEPVHQKYKSKKCEQFNGHIYCPYGGRCMFKHEERSFEILKNYYYVHALNIRAHLLSSQHTNSGLNSCDPDDYCGKMR